MNNLRWGVLVKGYKVQDTACQELCIHAPLHQRKWITPVFLQGLTVATKYDQVRRPGMKEYLELGMKVTQVK